MSPPPEWVPPSLLIRAVIIWPTICLPAHYQVKVTAASFLPSLRENVILRSGAHLIINLTVNTLADALKLMPARRSEH